MLKFANPEYFYLYILLPFLAVFLFWTIYYKRQLLKRLGDEDLISRLADSVSNTRRLIKNLLILASFALMFMALANPQIGTRLEEVKREGVDIFIALDVSKSMLAEDVAPNRFDRAKHEITQFIEKLRGDRVGIIAFSGVAFVQCPLTLDYSAARLFLDEIDVGAVPTPGTSIADAVNTAMTSFVNKELKHKVLILITDGEEHEGDPLEAAREAARQGVIIYSVGIGSPEGAPIPEYSDNGRRLGYKKDRNGQVVTTRLDIETLEKVALETGGRFYIASSGSAELDKIYEEIYSMEKKELSSREFTQFEDRFQIFLLQALILLLIEALLGDRRRRKSPEQAAA